MSYVEKRKLLRHFVTISTKANIALSVFYNHIKDELGEDYYLIRNDIDTLLIDGYLYYEKLYHNGKLLDFVQLDPATIIIPTSKNTIIIYGQPFNHMLSVIEGVYLGILDIENNDVIKRVSNTIISNIKEHANDLLPKEKLRKYKLDSI